MPQEPAPADPGRGVPPSGAQPEPGHWEPVITRPDPMSPDEWEALLAAGLDEVEPPEDGDEDLDPESCALPSDEDLAALEDETDRIAAERFADAQYLTQAETAELAAASAASEARKRGPRGPGLPGSADRVPGASGGRVRYRAVPGSRTRLSEPAWFHRNRRAQRPSG